MFKRNDATDNRVRRSSGFSAVAKATWPLERNMLVSDNRVRPEEISEYLGREAKHGPFALIVVDTRQAFFDGRDANNPTEAVTFTRRFRPLTRLSASNCMTTRSKGGGGAACQRGQLTGVRHDDRSGSEFVSGTGAGAGRDRLSDAVIVPSQSRLVS
jgi:hypothetical protein